MILEGIYLSRPLCKNIFIKFVYQHYNHIRLLNLQRPYTWMMMYGKQHLVLFVHFYKVLFHLVILIY